MKILAIDTATSAGGVSLYDDATGNVAECRIAGVQRQFSESLMEMVGVCLRNMSLELTQVDCLAVTKGPGSFTGLRVGFSTVKGLAYSTGRPVVAVSTLEAHAWMVPFHEGLVCPVLDARKGEVYAAVYAWREGRCMPVVEEAIFVIDELLGKITEPVLFLGDGLRAYREKILSVLGDKVRFAAVEVQGGVPSAAARLGASLAKAGKYADIETFAPQYLRRSEAELKEHTG